MRLGWRKGREITHWLLPGVPGESVPNPGLNPGEQPPRSRAERRCFLGRPDARARVEVAEPRAAPGIQ